MAEVANAPVTLGNYIRVPMDGSISRQTLIHELGHIWQYQTQGTAYISDSIYHQTAATIRTGSRDAAYTVTAQDLQSRSIHNLNAEQQATVIETFFADVSVRNDPNYVRFMREVRSARPLPEAMILEEAAFGPGGGRNMFEDPSSGRDRASGTVPLFRLEF